MGFVIALAGKGGTGKTTVAALLTRILSKKGSVLAVDADPNSNLAEALGVQPPETVGSILDAIAVDPSAIPAGMTKDRFIEYKVQTAVAEGDGFDILTMGKPEGPGCYCYINNVLRAVVDRLVRDYAYVVIDNEAGLEHLSRRTTRRADAFFILANPSAVSRRAAERINKLIDELSITTDKRFLIMNRSSQPAAGEPVSGVPLLGFLPEDAAVERMSVDGSSLTGLASDSPAFAALTRMADNVIR